jgi:hypothetical protein
LNYQFTRGTFSTVERNRWGGVITPHALAAKPGLTTNDVVER